MDSSRCHGRLTEILIAPMTLHEAQIEINDGVSGSDPAYVSLKQVFDAAASLLADGFIKIVEKRPPGHYDINDSLHVSSTHRPLFTFQATTLGASLFCSEMEAVEGQ